MPPTSSRHVGPAAAEAVGIAPRRVREVDRRAGRGERAQPRSDEGEVVVLHQHHRVVAARPRRSRRRTRRSPRGTRPRPPANDGRCAGGGRRSYRPWRQNHSVALQTTSYAHAVLGLVECEQSHAQPVCFDVGRMPRLPGPRRTSRPPARSRRCRRREAQGRTRSPPAPRCAVSPPSSSRRNDSGPRFDTITTGRSVRHELTPNTNGRASRGCPGQVPRAPRPRPQVAARAIAAAAAPPAGTATRCPWPTVAKARSTSSAARNRAAIVSPVRSAIRCEAQLAAERTTRRHRDGARVRSRARRRR